MLTNDPIARKKALIEAARLKGQPKAEDGAIQRSKDFIKPAEAKNRIRIVADNSGSMSASIQLHPDTMQNVVYSTRMKEAKKGIIEFLRNCKLNQDAVAVHLLNKPYTASDYEDALPLSTLISDSQLTTDLIRLASAVDNKNLSPTGGTPLFERIEEALNAEPKTTRIVAFSDGEASTYNEEKVVALANRFQVPIDTVFFGSSSDRGADMMKRLAESTGGIFIAFDPAKGVSFATAFRYLTEGNRKMLMNAEFKAKLERGEVK